MPRFKVTGVVLTTALSVFACGHAATPASSITPVGEGMDRVRRSDMVASSKETLACSEDRISYRYEGEKVHLLSGCGRTVRFLVFSLGEVWVKIESFHPRAAYELNCDEEKIHVSRVDEYTWSATGCGESVRYILSCEQAKPRCVWLEDSPSH